MTSALNGTHKISKSQSTESNLKGGWVRHLVILESLWERQKVTGTLPGDIDMSSSHLGALILPQGKMAGAVWNLPSSLLALEAFNPSGGQCQLWIPPWPCSPLALEPGSQQQTSKSLRPYNQLPWDTTSPRGGQTQDLELLSHTANHSRTGSYSPAGQQLLLKAQPGSQQARGPASLYQDIGSCLPCHNRKAHKANIGSSPRARELW